MSSPIAHGVVASGFIPAIRQNEKMFHELKQTHLLFVDNFSNFEKFGIDREEMIAVMPHLTTVDVLTGVQNVDYIDETPYFQ